MNSNPFHPKDTPLDRIGLEHKTDKASSGHDYLNRYIAYFDTVIPEKIVEVGIDGGASLRTWSEFFPHARILGIDINPKSVEQKFPSNVVTMLGDASTERLWAQVESYWGRNIDIIIDDGAHTGFSMIKMFQLAWPLVRSGGLYCVEDLHASYLAEYNRDDCSGLSSDLHGAQWPAIRYFTRHVSVMNAFGEGQTGNPAAGASDILFMHFSRSLLIIGKR